MKRQHRIVILKYVKGNFWVLVFPLIRGLFSMQSDIYHWVKGVYMDIIAILLMLGSAYLRWFFISYEAKEKEIYVKKGLLFRRELVLPYSSVSSVSCCKIFLLRPFRVAKITLDSDSYSASVKRKKAEVELIVPEMDCLQLFNKLPFGSEEIKVSYKASKMNLVFFSLLFSSALSGAIFIAAFFIQGRKMLGRHLEGEIISAVSDVTTSLKIIAEEVTPFSVALTMIIAGGWLVSFIINLLRYIRFVIVRCGNRITVENGYFSCWKYYVNSSRINYVDLRQNLLMKIAGIMSMHVSCTGYGERRKELPVFVPVTTRKRIMSMMKLMLPDFTQSNILLKTKRTYIAAYIWLPLTLVICVPIAAAGLRRVMPQWSETIIFLSLMAEIPLVYLLAVKIAAKMSAGVGVTEAALTVNYCKAYQFHTVVVPKGNIAYIKIRRTLFQRASGCCDVIVYTRGERVNSHCVKGLIYAEAENLVKNYDKMC